MAWVGLAVACVAARYLGRMAGDRLYDWWHIG